MEQTVKKLKTLNKTLFWFNRDLRTKDNLLLFQSNPILAIYINSPCLNSFQSNLIRIQLELLNSCLLNLNIPLLVIPASILSLVLSDFNITRVVANNTCAVRNGIDQDIINLIKQNGIEFQCADDECILKPGSVLTKLGNPYKVYTMFRNSYSNLI